MMILSFWAGVHMCVYKVYVTTLANISGTMLDSKIEGILVSSLSPGNTYYFLFSLLCLFNGILGELATNYHFCPFPFSFKMIF